MNLDVLVVGAGIGGLTAALCLARRGARVRIVERAPEIGEIGAGLQISPNGAAVLHALELGEETARLGQPLGAVVLGDLTEGTQVLRLDLTRAGYPHPYMALHRADLIAMLLRAARRAGVRVRTDTRIVEAGQTAGGAWARSAAGEEFEAAVIVGADGVRSGLGRLLFGRNDPAFSGQVAWRTIVPAPRGMPSEARVHMAGGRHLVSYPLRRGAGPPSVVNIVAVQETETWSAEGWHHADAPENLRAAFADAAPPVAALLERVTLVHRWGLFERQVPGLWHRGRIGLIGDAVHPTLPFLAQGANLAMEDAWVLAECLSRAAPAPEALDAAWGDFTRRRHARVLRAVRAARGNAGIYHQRPGPLRAALRLGMGLGGRLAPGLPLARFDWLYRHDVTDGWRAQASSSIQTGT